MKINSKIDKWAFHPIFRFSLVLADEVTKIWKYYIMCLFTFLKILACLALQTETNVKKITQPKLPKMKNEVTKICNEPGQIMYRYVHKYVTPGVTRCLKMVTLPAGYMDSRIHCAELCSIVCCWYRWVQ